MSSEIRKRPLEDDDYDDDGTEHNNQPSTNTSREESLIRAAASFESGQWEGGENTWVGQIPLIGGSKYPKFSCFKNNVDIEEIKWVAPKTIPAPEIQCEVDEQELFNQQEEEEDSDDNEESEAESELEDDLDKKEEMMDEDKEDETDESQIMYKVPFQKNIEEPHSMIPSAFELVEQVPWEGNIDWGNEDSDDGNDYNDEEEEEEEDETGKIIRKLKPKKTVETTTTHQPDDRDRDGGSGGGDSSGVLSVGGRKTGGWGDFQAPSTASTSSSKNSSSDGMTKTTSGGLTAEQILRKVPLNRKLLSGEWLEDVIWVDDDDDDDGLRKKKTKIKKFPLCLDPNDEHLYFLSIQKKKSTSSSLSINHKGLKKKPIIGLESLKPLVLIQRLQCLTSKPASFFNFDVETFNHQLNEADQVEKTLNGGGGDNINNMNGKRVRFLTGNDNHATSSSSSSSSSATTAMSVEAVAAQRARMQFLALDKKEKLEQSLASAGFEHERLNVNIRGGTHGRDASRWETQESLLNEEDEQGGLIHPSLPKNDVDGVFGGFELGNSHHRGRSSRSAVAPTTVPRPVIHHAEPAQLLRFSRTALFYKNRLRRISRGSYLDTFHHRLRVLPHDVKTSSDISLSGAASTHGLRNTSARMRSGISFGGVSDASRRSAASIKDERDLDIPPTPSSLKENGEFIILEYIEENPLFQTLPGMASKLHRYYQYTPAELAELKKRKRQEQAVELANNQSGDHRSGAKAVVNGGGMYDDEDAEEEDEEGVGEDDGIYASQKQPLVDLDVALSRPVGESFLWAAGWDANRPPLGGRYLRPYKKGSSGEEERFVLKKPNHKYHSPLKLVKEEISRRVEKEIKDQKEEELLLAEKEKQLKIQNTQNSLERNQCLENADDIVVGEAEQDSEELKKPLPLNRTNSSSSFINSSSSKMVSQWNPKEIPKEIGEKMSMRREQAPFLAHLKGGEEQLAIDNNLYRAPLFRHEAKSTDFLMVCYDDDFNCCNYVVTEMPKILLTSDYKHIQSSANAWRAIGLSREFINGDPITREHTLNEVDKKILYDILCEVYRKATNGSISSSNNFGDEDEDSHMGNFLGNLPSHVEVPLNSATSDVSGLPGTIKKLFIANTPDNRRDLGSIVNRPSFKAWGVSADGPQTNSSSNSQQSKGGKSVKNLGILKSKGTAAFTTIASLREIPSSRLFVVGQLEPQEQVPQPKSTDYTKILKDFVVHQLAGLFNKVPEQGVPKETLLNMFTDSTTTPPYRLFPGVDVIHGGKIKANNAEKTDEEKDEEWLEKNILRQALKQVASFEDKKYVAKPLRGQIEASSLIGEDKDSQYGVHPDDMARSGDFTPEKVCLLLSCMTWDRRLKDLGINQLQDFRKHKQTMVDFPVVIKALAHRERDAKKRAKDAAEMFASAKRVSFSSNNTLPEFALIPPLTYNQMHQHQIIISNTGKGKSHGIGDKRLDSFPSKFIGKGYKGKDVKLSDLPTSLRLPVLNKDQLATLSKPQVEVYWLGQRAVSLTEKKIRATRLLEVARAIYDEMQRTSWHITNHFVDGHIKEKNMLRLTGVGDPSGLGAGFSFVLDKSKAPKFADGDARGKPKYANDDTKDLRKLNEAQRIKVLLDLGLPLKDIKKNTRWQQTRLISELVRLGRGGDEYLSRYIRDKGKTHQEQREDYKQRCRVIWDKQAKELSSTVDLEEPTLGSGNALKGKGKGKGKQLRLNLNRNFHDNDDDDVDEDDDNDEEDDEEDDEDDLENAIGGSSGGLNAMDKDQAEYNNLFSNSNSSSSSSSLAIGVKENAVPANIVRPKKVIRRTVRYLDKNGVEHCVVQFRVAPEEELNRVTELELWRKNQLSSSSLRDGTPEHASKDMGGTFGKSNKVIKISATNVREKEAQKKNTLKISGIKNKIETDKASRKRDQIARDKEVTEMYKRPSGKEAMRSNRQAVRSSKPHIKIAEMFASLLDEVSTRPGAAVFLRPVPKGVAGYHERVKSPIDIQTIRDRCVNQYRYRDRASIVKEFELLASNAALFNGDDHEIAVEGRNILQFIKDKIYNDSKFEEAEALCQSVRVGRGGNKKGNQRSQSSKTNSPPRSQTIRITPIKNQTSTSSSTTTTSIKGPIISIKPISQPSHSSSTSSSSKLVPPKKPIIQDNGDSSSGEEEIIESSQA